MGFKLNKETAELVGVISGDGYLHNKENRIIIAGSLDDLHYYKNYLIPKFIKNFNVRPYIYKYKNKNSYFLQIENKKVFSFFINELGMKRGAKYKKIIIPNKILENKNFLKAFIRGLFDTDGCLKFSKQLKNFSYYPRIRLATQTSPMAYQIGRILKELGFNYSLSFDNKKTAILFVYEISGFENLDKWIREIGSSNLAHISKFYFIKKKGLYKPNLSLLERLDFLNMSLEDLQQGKLFKSV